MSARNDAVAAVVQTALEDATLTSQDLKERAAVVDESVLDLTGRQFHAMYALQARKRLREKAAGAPSAEPTTPEVENSAMRLLAIGYEEKRDALNEALHGAFQRALTTDSVARVNELLERLEAEIEALSSF